MLCDLPEYKKLWGVLAQNEVKFGLKIAYIEKNSLEERPNREAWLINQTGRFNEELNALHQALWERGHKVSLVVESYVPGYVTAEGDSPLTVKYPLGLDV